jgi:hypothetical protein
MLLTISLSTTETSTYCGDARRELLAYARDRAFRHGRRFAQIVGADGRILDVVENAPRRLAPCAA